MILDEYGSGRMNLDEVSLKYSLILYPGSNRSGNQGARGMRKERTKSKHSINHLKLKKDESEI